MKQEKRMIVFTTGHRDDKGRMITREHECEFVEFRDGYYLLRDRIGNLLKVEKSQVVG